MSRVELGCHGQFKRPLGPFWWLQDPHNAFIRVRAALILGVCPTPDRVQALTADNTDDGYSSRWPAKHCFTAEFKVIALPTLHTQGTCIGKAVAQAVPYLSCRDACSTTRTGQLSFGAWLIVFVGCAHSMDHSMI